MKQNIEGIFEKSSLKKHIPLYFMCLAVFAFITVEPILEYYEPMTLLFALIFPGAGFLICFLCLTSAPAFRTITVNGRPTTKTKPRIVFGLFFGLFFGGIPFSAIVLPALLVDTVYWVTYLTGMLSITGMLILGRNMKKRTPEGNVLLGKIRGFRNFLVTAEKNKLEMLVLKNPAYFYNILPFTYVLDVSDKWIKKIENIALQPPAWYAGTSAHRFQAARFGNFMNTAMKSASTVMSSGRSGGGRSGRGSGDGGGRSW